MEGFELGHSDADLDLVMKSAGQRHSEKISSQSIQ